MVAVARYRQTIDDFFASMPAAVWARTLPVGEHGVTVPTLWARQLSPPLVITTEEIDRMVAIVDESLTVAEKELGFR